jgi:hypothetical protein
VSGDRLGYLVAALVVARRARAKALAERNAAVLAQQPCTHENRDTNGPCHIAKRREYCPACAAALPADAAYHEAAKRAGSALRRVLAEGKRRLL